MRSHPPTHSSVASFAALLFDAVIQRANPFSFDGVLQFLLASAVGPQSPNVQAPVFFMVSTYRQHVSAMTCVVACGSCVLRELPYFDGTCVCMYLSVGRMLH
eukprot:6182756-Pleurochrysis_carterae.AAC.2